MALKILKKAEKPKGLPEGADRFVWTELPVKKGPKYAEVLKGPKRPT